MRFMIIVKASKQTEAGVMDQSVYTAMVDYHEELAKAGVLIAADGLQPTAKGWRVRYEGGKRRTIDGPFTETKELICGFTLIKVKSREEAEGWIARYPSPHSDGGEIEIRQLYDPEDLQEVDGTERIRELRTGGENG